MLTIVQVLQFAAPPAEQVPQVDSHGLHTRSVGSPNSLVRVQLASQSLVLLLPQLTPGHELTQVLPDK